MISIRQPKKEDFEALEKLYKELEEDDVLYQPEHFVFSKKGQRSQQLEQILQSENQIMLVAEEDGDGQNGFAAGTCAAIEVFRNLVDGLLEAGLLLLFAAILRFRQLGAGRCQILPHSCDLLRRVCW